MLHSTENSGFTLIELVIVVVIGVILTVGGFLMFSSYKNRKDLEFSLDEIFAVVKQTQSRAITQEDGKAWGVRFVSSSTGTDSYEIFHGNSYSSSSVESSRGFRRPVEFGEPSGGRTVDLEFGARTGKIDNKKVISIVHKNDLDKAGDIVVNTLGKATARMEDDIVGYWHFDEGTGTSTLDASGNSNTGVASGTTWTAAASCKAGGCLSFDGTDDYVDVGNVGMSEGSNFDWTVSMWFKSSAGQSAAVGFVEIDSSDTSNYIIIYPTDTYVSPDGYRVRIQDDSHTKSEFSGDTVLDDGQWHNLVLRSTSNSYREVYIDGSFSKSDNTVLGNMTDLDTTQIGASDLHGQYFNGNIDEVRMYDTALSSSTIKAHYEDLK